MEWQKVAIRSHPLSGRSESRLVQSKPDVSWFDALSTDATSPLPSLQFLSAGVILAMASSAFEIVGLVCDFDPTLIRDEVRAVSASILLGGSANPRPSSSLVLDEALGLMIARAVGEANIALR
jgi:hypothetical protein